MDYTIVLDLLKHLGKAALLLLVHPFFYLGIIIILLQVRKQIQLERKLFHARLHYLMGEAWRLVLWGLVAGAAVSVVMMLLGSVFTYEAMLLLWGITAILILFRIRFLCMVYAAAVLALVQWVAERAPAGADWEGTAWLYTMLERVHSASLLVLAGVLHLAEALLIRYQGSRLASPIFVESKRGKVVGGYHMAGYWPLSLFLLVPAGGFGLGSGIELPWQPLFGTGMAEGGWTFMILPVVLGFTEQTLSRLPAEKAKRASGFLILYAVLVVGFGLLAHWVGPLLLLAALVAIGLHELLIWYSTWEEEKRTPYYVHGEQGLKVLAVLPGSPAAELGIVPGEVISKVNGQRVRTKEELHLAVQTNAAYCRLEVLNLSGEPKFVNRALFAGDHHQLGLLLCPDEEARYVLEERRRDSLITSLYRSLAGLQDKKGKSESM